MKKDKFKRILKFLLPLIACGLICLLSGQRLVFRCLWWECVDSEVFESEDIQIPREFFPEEATYGTPGMDRETYGAKQHHTQQVNWGNTSRALLGVYRYFGLSTAKGGFSSEVRLLGEIYYIVPLEPTNKLNYESSFADQLFVGCSGLGCIFVARYDEDVIEYHTTIDRLMTLEDFKLIITYLDTVVAKRLGH